MRELVRDCSCGARTEVMEIEEELEAEGDVPLWENLVTQYRPEIRDGHVRIAGEKYACCVETQDLAGGFLVEEKKNSSHKGVLESMYCISWEVPARNGNTEVRKCRFRVVPAEK